MSVKIINADVMDGLRQLADESVHCVVTSPPYWGLRDYGTGEWEGGDAGCDHLKVSDSVKAVATSTLGGGKKSTGHQQEGFKNVCGKCGARRIDRQIGLEPTPAAYVARLVDVFREVRRVMRKDGTCWVNLGDSYAATTKGSSGKGEKQISNAGTLLADRRWSVPAGLKPKDLVGIPWRVAFALQDDGWWLRQDIIWSKPNPMPESVTDRCTKAHEYVFLLTKSAQYHYDADAIAESSIYAGATIDYTGNVKNNTADKVLQRTLPKGRKITIADTRNKRSVWTIATAPYSEAHFATFPPELPELCIKAGCPVGGTVLDPFGGAGTTGLVADRLQRNAVLIELNPDYAAMAEARIDRDRGGLLDIMEAAE